MGAFRIIYAFSTMFSLAYCSEYSFTVDVPAILNTFSNMATQAWFSTQALARASQDPDADADLDADSDADSDVDSDVKDPTLVRTLQKVTMDVVGYVSTMLNSLSLSRRTTSVKHQVERKPKVEMGPGSYKSEQVKYPPNYFVNRLKTLLNIQKKREEKNKPLNKPEK